MWQAGSSGAPGRRWPQNQATFDDDHKLSHCTVSSPPVNHPRSQNPLPPLHTLGKTPRYASSPILIHDQVDLIGS